MNPLARICWVILLALSVLGALNHFALLFYEDNTLAFAAYAGLNALAAIVLWFGYRSGQLWAWWGVWCEILALAAVAVAGDPTNASDNAGLQISYGVIAGVMALAQLGALPAFKK